MDMPADAFTAGVKPGGLTSVTEIRILLCYLIKTAGPVSREVLENALMQEQLVNYFELSSGLDDLAEQKLVTQENTIYTITKKAHRYRMTCAGICRALCVKVRQTPCCVCRNFSAWLPKIRQRSHRLPMAMMCIAIFRSMATICFR